MIAMVFHPAFYHVYSADPAAKAGRMEAVTRVMDERARLVEPKPAEAADIEAAHTAAHIQRVRQKGLYPVAALAAGAAIKTAELGLSEPAFGLLRPPGHHASADSSWGFCHFNNMVVALLSLKRRGLIETAYVLDIDLHYGDGTENLLAEHDWARVYNVEARGWKDYLPEVAREMANCQAQVIAISAGFDMHADDWGGVLLTEDYREIGRLARAAARRNRAGLFALLEGGYNQAVLGENVAALCDGMVNPG